jgi:hypothetical protein
LYRPQIENKDGLVKKGQVIITLKVKKWQLYTVQKQTPGLCTLKENSPFCCLTMLNVGVKKRSK